MNMRGAGHECIGKVDRPAPALPFALIATGAKGRLPRRRQVLEAVEQSFGFLPLLRLDTSLDLGDVDATRA